MVYTRCSYIWMLHVQTPLNVVHLVKSDDEKFTHPAGKDRVCLQLVRGLVMLYVRKHTSALREQLEAAQQQLAAEQEELTSLREHYNSEYYNNQDGQGQDGEPGEGGEQAGTYY